jgi:hypothetical protein
MKTVVSSQLEAFEAEIPRKKTLGISARGSDAAQTPQVASSQLEPELELASCLEVVRT